MLSNLFRFFNGLFESHPASGGSELGPSRIEATDHLSEYGKTTDKVLTINGVPTNILFDDAYPDYSLRALVPALIDAGMSPAERELVWYRILPSTGTSEIAPILICPDDLDLWCTKVIAG